MKVLISAIACEPGQGSEAKVGWDAVAAISKHHDCHVITHSVYRDSIRRSQDMGILAEVKFHYHGNDYTWHPNRWIARLQSWLIYRKWQGGLLEFAANLHGRYGFDVAHHVTYASWRVPSELWRLPVPFVWGPIGGAGTMPKDFRHMLSPSARLFESLRDISTAMSSRSMAFLRCARESSTVIAANEESRLFLENYRNKGDIAKLPVAYFSHQQTAALERHHRRDTNLGEPLQIFAGGNLIGAKGLSIALQGAALARQRGLDFTYTIAGGGPELHRLQALAQNLQLTDVVRFHTGYRGASYHEKLRSSDVYLMPSFRDTTPVTLLEAIIAGCYPIVADTSAAGEIVRSVGGDAIPLTNSEGMARGICHALLRCSCERGKMTKLGTDAANKVVRLFSEEAYSKGVNSAYFQATQSV